MSRVSNGLEVHFLPDGKVEFAARFLTTAEKRLSRVELTLDGTAITPKYLAKRVLARLWKGEEDVTTIKR